MSAVRRVIGFYRLQWRVLRTWAPGRRAFLLRIGVSFLMSFVALAAVAWLLPGVVASDWLAVAAAVVILALVNVAIRPVLLWLFAAFSVIAIAVATLIMQVVAFLAVAWLVAGFDVSGWVTALIASFLYGILGTILDAVFAIDDADSYWATLVQQLQARRSDAIRTTSPGLVVVQIDGLAHEVLTHQLRAGRVPFLSSLIRDGTMHLDRWEALLPSQTSASQAGILHGNNSFIPAFRWYEKDRGVLMVSNHPRDAAEIVRRASDGHGLLSNDGASVGNLVSGDAVRSYITMATITDKRQGLGNSRSFYTFFVSPVNYLHLVTRWLGEVGKEYLQARRQRTADMVPRMHRGMPYPLTRASTNTVLRALSSSLVMEEMFRGTPVIYVDYTDFDEIAHHSGPERAESLDSLDGVDGALRALWKAAASTPRPYRFVILSDHGQSLGRTFLDRYGESLEQVVARLMGGATIQAATGQDETYGPVNALLSEVGQTGGRTGAITRAALSGRTTDGVVDLTPAPEAQVSATETKGPSQPAELVVCGSGNLGLIYFARRPGRLTREAIDAAWPGLLDALRAHPGIGFVMVRSETDGPVALGPAGSLALGTGSVEGTDPVAPFSGHPVEGLLRVDAMDHCPDILAISVYEPQTGEVAAFEELIGSHGGLGGAQTEPFILHPADWTIDEPLVGAEAVYGQLRTWLEGMGIPLGPPDGHGPA